MEKVRCVFFEVLASQPVNSVAKLFFGKRAETRCEPCCYEDNSWLPVLSIFHVHNINNVLLISKLSQRGSLHIN